MMKETETVETGYEDEVRHNYQSILHLFIIACRFANCKKDFGIACLPLKL